MAGRSSACGGRRETGQGAGPRSVRALFNKRDYDAAERFWSENYIQHSALIPPGEALFNRVRSLPSLRYENQPTVAEGDYVMLYGRAARSLGFAEVATVDLPTQPQRDRVGAPRERSSVEAAGRNLASPGYAAWPVRTTPPFDSTTPSAQDASTSPSWNCSW
jgi:hypothetical protein